MRSEPRPAWTTRLPPATASSWWRQMAELRPSQTPPLSPSPWRTPTTTGRFSSRIVISVYSQLGESNLQNTLIMVESTGKDASTFLLTPNITLHITQCPAV